LLAPPSSYFFSFTNPSPSLFFTLSLHDALPICAGHHSTYSLDRWRRKRRKAYCRVSIRTLGANCCSARHRAIQYVDSWEIADVADRKSTRLNSSHGSISYAVFCLKKKKKTYTKR